MMVVTVMLLVKKIYVAMVHVSLILGNVMDGLTELMVQTKLIALLQHVKNKAYGIVVMANVFLHTGFAMDQLIPVTQAGVLTVLMAQMKV